MLRDFYAEQYSASEDEIYDGARKLFNVNSRLAWNARRVDGTNNIYGHQALLHSVCG